MKLKNLGFFNYFAKYGSLCENEHCAMVIGEYNGNLNLNEEVGYGYKWMDKNKFLKEVKKNSCEFTEWTKQGLKVLENSGFFN